MIILDNIIKQNRGLIIAEHFSKQSRGFTIVELLVVIVVIGILAAITIVSYTGITAKANTSANKQNASSVLSVAQIVYANTGAFPVASANAIGTLNGSPDAKLPTGITVGWAVETAGTAIRYIVNAAGTGICVTYWDYSGAGSKATLYGGVATADSNASTANTTCTP
jgi:prepilin-type N-terminal cleavage/methylation domain-containing protein